MEYYLTFDFLMLLLKLSLQGFLGFIGLGVFFWIILIVIRELQINKL